MDDFYYEESNSRYVFINCLIIIFILGLCVGVFIYIREKNVLKLKKIEIELGSELSKNINDYLENEDKNSSEYKLYLDEVNVNKAGTYEYKIRYNKHVEKGKIVIKDTIKPEVLVADISIGIDEKIEPVYLVTSCKDLSLPCSAVFEDEDILEKIKTPGTYETKIKVSDASGNSVTKSVAITSSKNGNFSSVMTSDLNYYTNNINDNTLEEIYFKKLDQAIDEDTLEYENLIQIISSEDFENYTSKEISKIQLITAYNKYGYVIGIQVLATNVDGTQELLTNEIEEGE